MRISADMGSCNMPFLPASFAVGVCEVTSPLCVQGLGVPHVLGGRNASISGVNIKKDKQTSRGSRVAAELEKAAGSSS